MMLPLVGLGVVLINLPFGYWRQGQRRLSPRWFLAIHAPIPLVVGLRILSGLGFGATTFPVTVGAYFLGQFLGGRLHRRVNSGAQKQGRSQ